MTPDRTNRILIGLLIIQLIALAVVYLPSTLAANQPALTGGALLKDFAPDNVTAITLRDGDNNTITLTKVDGAWVYPKGGNFPVTPTQVTTFLSKLQGLRTNRLIAESRTSHNRLKVAADSFERKIEVTLTDNRAVTVYVGTSAGANATHMRLDGDDRVYLTSGLAAFDAPATIATWISTSYLSADQANIVALRVVNAQGEFILTKGDAGWTLIGLSAGEQVNQDAVNRLLGQVSSVSLSEPLGKQDEERFGLKQPAVVVSFTTRTEIVPTVAPTVTPASIGLITTTPPPPPTAAPAQVDEKNITLSIGAKLDAAYAAKASTAEYYVTISAPTAEAFTRLARADLLVQQPTATPG
jgi:hypothetical protein